MPPRRTFLWGETNQAFRRYTLVNLSYANAKNNTRAPLSFSLSRSAQFECLGLVDRQKPKVDPNAEKVEAS